MVLSTEQYQVLQAMDIPVWELRSQTEQPLSDTTDELSLDLNQVTHIVICDVPAHSTAEFRLLHAILAAIKFPQDTLAVINAEQAQRHQSELIDKTVISFTEVSIGSTLSNMPSLQQQIENPSLKSVVWSTLRASV